MQVLPKKKGTININLKTAGAVGVSATLNNVEGGEEVKDAAKVAYGIYQPVGSTAAGSAAGPYGVLIGYKRRIGDFIVIKKMMKDSGIKSIIENVFENESGLFLDLVAYSIVTENNAAQYYPDYGYNHPLFTPEYRIYSDSKISAFLSSITNDQRLEVLNCWNDRKNHDNHIYISYDSTNKNVQAGEIDIAEFGHAKDDDTKPVVNVGMGYDYENREPLFYEEYPGSIVDVSQLKYMVDKAIGYGYKKVGFVLDCGYFSKGNLKYLDENQMPFVIMAKGNARFINGFVKEVQGTFEEDRKKRISKYKVYGTTVITKSVPRKAIFIADELAKIDGIRF